MSWNNILYRQLHRTARDSLASTKVLERGFVQCHRLELGCFKWSEAASLSKRSLCSVGALLRAAVGTQSKLSLWLGSDGAGMDPLLEGAVNRNGPAVRGPQAAAPQALHMLAVKGTARFTPYPKSLLAEPGRARVRGRAAPGALTPFRCCWAEPLRTGGSSAVPGMRCCRAELFSACVSEHVCHISNSIFFHNL